MIQYWGRFPEDDFGYMMGKCGHYLHDNAEFRTLFDKWATQVDSTRFKLVLQYFRTRLLDLGDHFLQFYKNQKGKDKWIDIDMKIFKSMIHDINGPIPQEMWVNFKSFKSRNA